jgi:hypothetical protein
LCLLILWPPLIERATLRIIIPMSKTEILEELPKLTPEDRQEIRLKLAELDVDDWLDSDDPLTYREKALLEARLDDVEKHPENSIPWSEAEDQLKARYGE